MAQKVPLPDFDQYRINMVIDKMKRIRKTSQDNEKHMILARRAFDEIQRTGEYEFGQKLFEKIKAEFTELIDEIEPMLRIIRKSLD